ncbi:MAG: hypothetical protein H0X51_02535 [Parachlamydiaceae bacterium]|nr:hypothetical protein [Parachlamydiaceae bacterium]
MTISNIPSAGSAFKAVPTTRRDSFSGSAKTAFTPLTLIRSLSNGDTVRQTFDYTLAPKKAGEESAGAAGAGGAAATGAGAARAGSAETATTRIMQRALKHNSQQMDALEDPITVMRRIRKEEESKEDALQQEREFKELFEEDRASPFQALFSPRKEQRVSPTNYHHCCFTSPRKVVHLASFPTADRTFKKIENNLTRFVLEAHRSNDFFEKEMLIELSRERSPTSLYSQLWRYIEENAKGDREAVTALHNKWLKHHDSCVRFAEQYHYLNHDADVLAFIQDDDRTFWVQNDSSGYEQYKRSFFNMLSQPAMIETLNLRSQPVVNETIRLLGEYRLHALNRFARRFKVDLFFARLCGIIASTIPQSRHKQLFDLITSHINQSTKGSKRSNAYRDTQGKHTDEQHKACKQKLREASLQLTHILTPEELSLQAAHTIPAPGLFSPFDSSQRAPKDAPILQVPKNAMYLTEYSSFLLPHELEAIFRRNLESFKILHKSNYDAFINDAVYHVFKTGLAAASETTHLPAKFNQEYDDYTESSLCGAYKGGAFKQLLADGLMQLVKLAIAGKPITFETAREAQKEYLNACMESIAKRITSAKITRKELSSTTLTTAARKDVINRLMLQHALHSIYYGIQYCKSLSLHVKLSGKEISSSTETETSVLLHIKA